MFKKIIWANDGSITTERLLPVVRQLAEANSGAKFIVAHVQEHLTIGRKPILDEDHRALDAALRRTVDTLNAEGIDAELALTDGRAGHAAEVLADLARDADADLIVAGSHRQGPVAGLFKGGFTIHLLEFAPCPVLAVPTRKARTTAPEPADVDGAAPQGPRTTRSAGPPP